MKKYLFSTVVGLFLIGCEQKPLSCDNEDNFSTLRGLLFEHSVMFGGKRDIIPSTLPDIITFSNTRIKSFNKEINLYQCQTEVTFEEIAKITLTYDSQRLENGEQYVEITTPLLPGDLARIGTFIQQAHQTWWIKISSVKADGFSMEPEEDYDDSYGDNSYEENSYGE